MQEDKRKAKGRMLRIMTDSTEEERKVSFLYFTVARFQAMWRTIFFTACTTWKLNEAGAATKRKLAALFLFP